MESELIKSDNGSYFYYKCLNPLFKKGNIIFIHGFATTSKYHDIFIKHIIDEYDYIALQLPGAGYEQWNFKKRPTMEDMYSYCIKLIESLSIEKFILLGHSMGGGLAVRLANYFKDRTICLICSTPMNSRISFLKATNYLLFNPKNFKKTLKLNNILYNDFVKTMNSCEKTVEKFIKYELEYQLKHRKFFIELKKSMFSLKNRKEQRINEQQLSTPTLVIAGKYDKIIPAKSLFKAFSTQKKLHKDIITIKLMDNSAHVPFQEQEKEYAKEIRNFLSLFF